MQRNLLCKWVNLVVKAHANQSNNTFEWCFSFLIFGFRNKKERDLYYFKIIIISCTKSPQLLHWSLIDLRAAPPKIYKCSLEFGTFFCHPKENKLLRVQNVFNSFYQFVLTDILILATSFQAPFDSTMENKNKNN